MSSQRYLHLFSHDNQRRYETTSRKGYCSECPEKLIQVDYIIPTICDSSVTQNVARLVRDAAIASGVARRELIIEMDQDSSIL